MRRIADARSTLAVLRAVLLECTTRGPTSLDGPAPHGVILLALNTSPDLVATLRARPDDDAPRLALAHSLRDRGAPRGEFIELQCAMARSVGGESTRALGARADQLLAAHGEEWCEALGLRRGEAVWTRGFVEDVLLTPERLDEVGARLSREVPLRSLRLRGLHGDTPRLARALAHPLLEAITTLDLSGNRLGPGAAHEIDLEKCALHADGARALSSAQHLRHLASLRLNHNDIGPDGVRALCAAAHLDRLTRLELMFNAIGDGGALALASAHHLARLQTLNLLGNGIGVEGARALASAPHLAGLRTLSLAGNNLGDEGLCAVASSATLAALTALRVGGNSVSIEGMTALTSATCLPSLKTLSLGQRWRDEVAGGFAVLVALQRAAPGLEIEGLTREEQRLLLAS
jgi:uncharacterized protein (TIGR02996 family)